MMMMMMMVMMMMAVVVVVVGMVPAFSVDYSASAFGAAVVYSR